MIKKKIIFLVSYSSNAAAGIFRNDDGLNNSILSLKILAKFLGFIESMAFHYNEDSRSDKLMEPCVKNRQNVRGLTKIFYAAHNMHTELET